MRTYRSLLLAAASLFSAPAIAKPLASAAYQHVLLISIDGLHAVDLTNWIDTHPGSAIAQLAKHGVVYPNTFTTAPSDSYPGMIAQVTGASPKTAGLFYDDSYDRTEYPSVNYWVSQGLTDPGCSGASGTEVTNFEELDKSYNFQTGLVADLAGGGSLDQVLTQLDPNNMQRHIVNGKCVPVYPHEYLRTNTIFEVIRDAGLYTAWSDKHPAYEVLNGPSGDGLNELFVPEINSQDLLDAGAQPGDDYTTSYTGVRSYDSVKVKAVLNWIDGMNATGAYALPGGAPAVFGMNFQAVSVGQKLAKSGNADTDKSLTGGYLNGNAKPGSALTLQLNYVDQSIGAMEAELVKQGLAQNTLVIISAKHGQSPINKALRRTMSDSGFQGEAGYSFEICDDEALIWLQPQAQKADYSAAEKYLKANMKALHIAQLLDRTSLTPLYGDPFSNSRVPDFIAVTQHGEICTGGTKLAEHGGFSNDDRNVALLVSNPAFKSEIVESLTYTTQIAPTILAALGLNPNALEGVRKEGTPVLSH